MITHYGFDKTTVDDIAREAGVSKGAIYLHWSSKDALFEALVWRETWDYIDDYLAAMDDDPQGGTLPNMLRHSLAVLQSRPLMRAMYNRDLRILGDFVRRRDPQAYSKKHILNKEFIQTMRAAGLVRQDLDDEAVAYLLSSISQGLLTMDATVPQVDALPFERIVVALSDMLNRALLPEDHDAAANSDAGKRLMHDLVDHYKRMSPDMKF